MALAKTAGISARVSTKKLAWASSSDMFPWKSISSVAAALADAAAKAPAGLA